MDCLSIPSREIIRFFSMWSKRALTLLSLTRSLFRESGGNFTGFNRPKCEPGHLPLPNSEVKNAPSYTSPHAYMFMKYLIKDMENLSLYKSTF